MKGDPAMVGGGLILVAAGPALMTLADVHSSWVAILPSLVVVCVGTASSTRLSGPSLSAPRTVPRAGSPPASTTPSGRAATERLAAAGDVPELG